MSDPISVRHVMASAEITERITKAEGTTQQALNEEFTKELSRQEALKQIRIAKEEEQDKVRDGRRKKERDEEKRKAAAKSESEEESSTEPGDSDSNHIIDLQV